MAKITKVYDVVNTDRMACEDIGSFNFGEYGAASGGIQNGRLVELDHTNKEAKYASAITGVKLFLAANVENMYKQDSFTTYMVEEGKKVATKELAKGDFFTTSACADTYGDVSVGDVLMVKATTGELTDKGVETPDYEFTVRAKKVFGGVDCLELEVTKLA